jgi:signal transduction histidine kinase
MRGEVSPSDSHSRKPVYVCIDEQRLNELMHALDEARNLAARQSLTMASAGHDLGQRLQTIALAIDLGLPPGEETVARSWLQLAKNQVIALGSSLKRLALQADFGVDELTPSRASFPVQNVLRQIDTSWGRIASSKRIKLEIPACDACAFSSAEHLATILDNLVGNAIKHAGRDILVSCTCRSGVLFVSVRDRGPGISDHDLRRIFDPYWHGSTCEDGMGLGLAIVRRTAALLEHEISVHSVVGRGTCFTVHVPLAPGGCDAGDGRGAIAVAPMCDSPIAQGASMER